MGKRDTGNITTEPQAGAPLRANADACSDQEPRLVEPQTLIRHRYKSVLEESILHSCPQDVHRSRSTKYKLRKKNSKSANAPGILGSIPVFPFWDRLCLLNTWTSGLP